MIAELPAPPRAVVFDGYASDQIDLTSCEVLVGLLKDLRGNGIVVCFAEMHQPVIEYSRKSGLFDAIGEEHIFPTVDLAVRNLARLSTDAPEMPSNTSEEPHDA